VKIVGRGVEGYEFVLVTHENPHLLQWLQKHFAQHHVGHPLSTMRATKKMDPYRI
jgi:hypothetical protein